MLKSIFIWHILRACWLIVFLHKYLMALGLSAWVSNGKSVVLNYLRLIQKQSSTGIGVILAALNLNSLCPQVSSYIAFCVCCCCVEWFFGSFVDVVWEPFNQTLSTLQLSRIHKHKLNTQLKLHEQYDVILYLIYSIAQSNILSTRLISRYVFHHQNYCQWKFVFKHYQCVNMLKVISKRLIRNFGPEFWFGRI